jgi:2-C-methyl-D-erythritol 4-phosphate cytidylyltransferase
MFSITHVFVLVSSAYFTGSSSNVSSTMKLRRIRTRSNNHGEIFIFKGCLSEVSLFFMSPRFKHNRFMSQHSIIITAGGTGQRMGSHLPKQFLPLAGKPLLFHTLQRFADFDPQAQLVLSLPADWHDYWKDLCTEYDLDLPHTLVAGGTERFHSIQNALKLCTGALIAVHDGVRPLVDPETIRLCFTEAALSGAAIPVVPVQESLRQTDGQKSHTVLRADYRLVQTPQVFQAALLRKAYEADYHAGITDDASLVEASGIAITLVAGTVENIKITTPIDLQLAELLLKSKA